MRKKNIRKGHYSRAQRPSKFKSKKEKGLF